MLVRTSLTQFVTDSGANPTILGTHTHRNREQYVRNLDLRLFHVQKKQSIFYNFSVFLDPWSLGPGSMVLLYVHRHHIAGSGLASATPPPKAPTHPPPGSFPSQAKPELTMSGIRVFLFRLSDKHTAGSKHNNVKIIKH